MDSTEADDNGGVAVVAHFIYCKFRRRQEKECFWLLPPLFFSSSQPVNLTLWAPSLPIPIHLTRSWRSSRWSWPSSTINSVCRTDRCHSFVFNSQFSSRRETWRIQEVRGERRCYEESPAGWSTHRPGRRERKWISRQKVWRTQRGLPRVQVISQRRNETAGLHWW